MNPPENNPPPVTGHKLAPESGNEDEPILDFRDFCDRLGKGFNQIIGFGALGLFLAAVIYIAFNPFRLTTTTSRVVFSFSGYEKGEYPDKSKFQADDIRAPDVIADALSRKDLDSSQNFQSEIRGAVTVEGVIPPNVVKERDRLRAAGQTLPVYLPDEYLLTLSLPRKFALTDRQREQLLGEIVASYRSKFLRTYANVPLGFGNAFETLKDADFFEYELVLNQEMQNIGAYLEEKIENTKSFRSQTTNMSFGDLLRQTQLFTQIRLNETLGLIRENGLSLDRKSAMVKMDYYLQTLEDQESKAVENEKVVRDLLGQTEEHAGSYVLGVKSQAVQARPETPILDQGLIDSLLANDSYNFLVRQALNAGFEVKRIQAEKSILLERRKIMEDYINDPNKDKKGLISEVQTSLVSLQSSYSKLIENIRKTNDDFEKQRFADAVLISMQPKTESFYKETAIAATVGLILGLLGGTGLSLVGIVVGPKKH